MQPIECKAAIAWEAEKPLDVTTVIVGPPQKGEVRVKVSMAENLSQNMLLLDSRQQVRERAFSPFNIDSRLYLPALSSSWMTPTQRFTGHSQQKSNCCRLMPQRSVTQIPTLWMAMVTFRIFLHQADLCILSGSLRFCVAMQRCEQDQSKAQESIPS